MTLNLFVHEFNSRAQPERRQVATTCLVRSEVVSVILRGLKLKVLNI